MADDGFFSRWSRRKAEAAQQSQTQQTQQKPKPASPPVKPAAEQALPPDTVKSRDAERTAPDSLARAAPQPTLEDVARLTSDSDFSAFVARGVDEAVRRQALKKLFSDPHFNVMDGLDIYIDDYNKFEPIPPEMLATLEHAKSTLNPLAQLEKPLMQLTQDSVETAAVDTAAGAPDAPAPSAEAVDDALAPPAQAGQPAGASETPDGGEASSDDAASTASTASIHKISDDPSNDHTV